MFIRIKNLEKHLFNIFAFLAGISLFLPLIGLRKTIWPYIFGKMIVFQAIVLILLLVWAVLMSLDWEKYKPKLNIITVSAFIFILIIFLSSIFGQNFYRSFWGNAERMEGCLSLFYFFSYFLALFSVFKNKPAIFKKLIFISLLACFISFIWILLQKLGWLQVYVDQDAGQLMDPFGNKTFASGYFLVSFFLAAWYFLSGFLERRKLDLTSGSAIIFALSSLTGLFLLQTRGSLLGLLGGIIIFLIISFFIFFSKKKKFIAGILLVLIIIAGVALTPGRENLKNKIMEDSSSRARMMTWKWSLDWFRQNPALGAGQSMFGCVFDKNFNPENFSLVSERLDKAHNKFINTLVTGGILGLLSYLFLIFSLFWVLGEKLKKEKRGKQKILPLVIISLLVSYIIHLFFSFESPVNYLLFFFILAWISSFSSPGDWLFFAAEKREKNSDSALKILIIFALSLVLAGYIFYQTGYKPYQAGRLVFQEALEKDFQNIEKSFDYYRKAISKNTFLNLEIRKIWANRFLEFIHHFHSRNIAINSGLLRSLADEFESEIKTAAKQEEVIDLYSFPATIFARLKWQYGENNQENILYYQQRSDYWFTKLRQIWPLRTDYLILEAENNFFSRDFDKLESLLNEIFKQTPDYGRALWLKAVLQIARGGFDDGVFWLGKSAENGYKLDDWRNSDSFSFLIEIMPKENKDYFLQKLDEEFDKFDENFSEEKTKAFSYIAAQFHIELISQNFSQMAKYLEISTVYNPNNKKQLEVLALCYGKLKEKEKAISTARKLAQKYPEEYSESSKIFIDIIQREAWNELP